MRVNYQFINVKTIHSSKRLKKKLFFTEKNVSSTHRDVELLL